MAEQLRVADSTHSAAVKEQIVQHDSAVQARKEAAELRRLARQEVKRDSVIRARTDSTIRASADARSHADSVAQDSTSSLATVRAEIGRLIQSGRADSVGYAREREQSQRTTMALRSALLADSTAIQRGLSELAASTRRAIAAESQVTTLKASRPSIVGRWLERAAWLGLVYVVASKRSRLRSTQESPTLSAMAIPEMPVTKTSLAKVWRRFAESDGGKRWLAERNDPSFREIQYAADEHAKSIKKFDWDGFFALPTPTRLWFTAISGPKFARVMRYHRAKRKPADA